MSNNNIERVVTLEELYRIAKERENEVTKNKLFSMLAEMEKQREKEISRLIDMIKKYMEQEGIKDVLTDKFIEFYTKNYCRVNSEMYDFIEQMPKNIKALYKEFNEA